MTLPTLLAFLPLLAPQSDVPLRHLVLLERASSASARPEDAWQRTLREHREYVARLLADGSAILGGPAPDAAYGVLVLALSDRGEVERLMHADPAVKAGFFTVDIRPFRGVSALDLVPRPTLPQAADGLAPLRFEVTVPAPLGEVWRAWSTPQGAETFFAPQVELELTPMGRLEVWWSPTAPSGERGAEDLHVLAYAPERMLAFEWSAPPQFPRARPERTFVVVELEALAAERTRVVLLHQGFDEQAQRAPELAKEWQDVRAYFATAWPTVLAALERRFRSGPIDWTAMLAK